MPKCILTEQHGSSGSSIVPQSITIKNPPTKTNYLAGDTFDSSGMVVEATYAIDSIPVGVAEVIGYTISPTILTDGITAVTITYSEGGAICTATQPVTVTHKLTEIAVTTNPVKTSYEYGDTLTTVGMVVTATYSDGKTENISDYSCSPTDLNTVTNSQAITVSYTENGVTKTTTFEVVVNRKSVAKPTWKGDLTYNGNAQFVNDISYWDNYDTTYMSIGGTTSSTNAGTYIATFTLKDNYRWADGTIDALDVSWVINKAIGSLTLSATTVAITDENYSTGMTITVSGDFGDVVSITPTSVTGLTLSVSGKTIIVKGDGSTNVSPTTITVVSANTNYDASATFTVSAKYWSWGNETAIGDATWWAGLKAWAVKATTTERAACVGKKKLVSLFPAVLGANAATMICIGADQDGTGTLTFQTAGTLPDTFVFGGSSAYWIDSIARTHCQSFYNACSAKASIKTVKKGLAAYNNSRNGAVAYTDETVWLPSEREMGLDAHSSLSTANSTTSKAECTQGYNASYSYYTSNDNRKKFAMDANGNITTATSSYWERSCQYYNKDFVCFVDVDGNANSNYYNVKYNRLAPAFVIG